MPKGKNFPGRLKELKKRHGLNNRAMGALFGVGDSMYSQLQRGAYVPEHGTLNRYIKLLEKYERENDLSKYLSGIHEHSAPVRAGAEIYGIDYYIEENKTLRDEIRSLKKTVLTNETTITFLHEEISRLKTALETAARNN